MNPIYKFQLSAGTDTRQAFPVYKDDLAIEYALEQNEQFYRGKLSGKLTFLKDDYLFIQSKAFDTQFDVVISISYNGGQTWAVYWSGQFWKTDCEFNEDDQTAIVTPTVNDRYNAVLAGMEKEYNLIELVPEMVPVKYDKRPMIQIYTPGQSVIACFLSGMWWEQECDPVNEDEEIEIEGVTENKLTEYLHFAECGTNRVISLTGEVLGDVPDSFNGPIPQSPTTGYEFTNGGYKWVYAVYPYGGNQYEIVYEIQRISDSATMWSYTEVVNNPLDPPYSVTLSPVTGTGLVTANISDVRVYGRYVCDVEMIGTLNTYPIPDDDLVPDNRNYSRVIGYSVANTVFFSSRMSSEPTEYGLYQPGKYYMPPYSIGINEFFPVSRASWGRMSVWFAFDWNDWTIEQRARKEYTLMNAIPISSVIAVLLGKIAPNISHEGTTNYSAFLYSTNPISNINQRLFITPKSNLISAGYDQPAQKAPITFKMVTDMLRDCFRCYWFVDEQNRFRVEHISWFMNGGAYPGTPNFPVVGMDLTQQIVTRNGKPWSYARNQYGFDKPEMAARYQFGWMDDVTQLFEGYPIDIISKYVNPDNIEQINVSQFTSDVDYILLNPGAVSKDGFVLLAASLTDGEYKLPYVNFEINLTDHILQNAWVSFMYLQRYYLFDTPAADVEINGVPQLVYGTKKLKTQTINFPVLAEPDMFALIKTGLGNGTIQKMSVNLSSRNANTTLKYDTE